jgi:hypothetical protein
MADPLDRSFEQPAARRKPAGWWKLITLIAGIAGATSAVAIGGHGSYDMPPFRTELRARPAVSGKTELAVRAPIIGRAHTEANTHSGPISFRVTITGISGKATASDLAALRDPHDLITLIKQKDSAAVRSFAIKLGLLALGGGFAGGLVVSLGRWRRMLGGALAGLLAIGIVGAVVGATYNTDAFAKTHFVVDRGSVDKLPSLLPTL